MDDNTKIVHNRLAQELNMWINTYHAIISGPLGAELYKRFETSEDTAQAISEYSTAFTKDILAKGEEIEAKAAQIAKAASAPKLTMTT